MDIKPETIAKYLQYDLDVSNRTIIGNYHDEYQPQLRHVEYYFDIKPIGQVQGDTRELSFKKEHNYSERDHYMAFTISELNEALNLLVNFCSQCSLRFDERKIDRIKADNKGIRDSSFLLMIMERPFYY